MGLVRNTLYTVADPDFQITGGVGGWIKIFFSPGLKIRGARVPRASPLDPPLTYYIPYSASYASLFSMELEKQLMNYKIPVSCLANMPAKHYSKNYKQQK